MAVRIAVGLVSALLVGLLVAPLLRRLAHRLNITDRPDALLKPHAQPTAYLGGAGIYVAWLAGLLATLAVGWPESVGREVWVVAAAAVPVLGVGLIDDIRGIRPVWRVMVEVAAAVALWFGGVQFVAVPGLAPDGPVMQVVGLGLQIALVLGACNAINLLDGLDGLCAGVTGIAVVSLIALLGGVLYLGRCAGQDNMSRRVHILLVLTPPLAGALFGFLRYNYPPAGIFMGDSGSLLLGFMVAGCGALLAGPGWLGLHLGLSGLVIIALPVGDTALALYRRGRSGRPLFEGDRSHLYDQLVDRGLSVARTVQVCYLISVVFAAVAWVGAVLLPVGWALLVYGVAVLAAIWALRRFGFTRADPAPQLVPPEDSHFDKT